MPALFYKAANDELLNSEKFVSMFNDYGTKNKTYIEIEGSHSSKRSPQDYKRGVDFFYKKQVGLEKGSVLYQSTIVHKQLQQQQQQKQPQSSLQQQQQQQLQQVYQKQQRPAFKNLPTFGSFKAVNNYKHFRGNLNGNLINKTNHQLAQSLQFDSMMNKPPSLKKIQTYPSQNTVFKEGPKWDEGMSKISEVDLNPNQRSIFGSSDSTIKQLAKMTAKNSLKKSSNPNVNSNLRTSNHIQGQNITLKSRTPNDFKSNQSMMKPQYREEMLSSKSRVRDISRKPKSIFI